MGSSPILAATPDSSVGRARTKTKNVSSLYRGLEKSVISSGSLPEDRQGRAATRNHIAPWRSQFNSPESLSGER